MTALFPLHSIRDEVAKNFERCIEFMWYRIHGNKLSPAEQKMNNSFEKMSQDMARLLTEIRDELKDQRPNDTQRRRGA